MTNNLYIFQPIIVIFFIIFVQFSCPFDICNFRPLVLHHILQAHFLTTWTHGCVFTVLPISLKYKTKVIFRTINCPVYLQSKTFFFF